MLGLLDTGRMAKQYGKHRGWMVCLCGAVFWMIAFVVLFLKDVVYGLVPSAVARAPGLTSLDWIALAVAVFGSLVGLYGVWLLYRDEVHGDHLIDADRYKREGW